MIPIRDKINNIEKKLDDVEARLKDKWILPVSIALITAILTLGNYFIQRLYSNADIRRNELTKANAQVSSKSTSDFYQLCYGKMDTINKNFNSYCNITPSDFEDSIINRKLIELTASIDKQFPLDPKVQSCLKEYNSFIGEHITNFETATPSNDQLIKAYNGSKILYDKAITEINAAFLNPSR